MSYLLDTNVVSEARRVTPNEHVLKWLGTQPLSSTYLSVMTLGELEEGISLLGDTRKAQTLRTWFATLKASYMGRILPIDETVVTTWGKIRAGAKARGRTTPAIDTLLAATAITHNLTLVTRNIDDVAALPVKTLNPFEGRHE